MKKLTAGILASLIGLVSANSADAAVASTKYVEDRVEALDSAQAYGDKATDSLKYIKYVNETDGVLDAAEGTLSKVATSGDYNDLTTKLQFVGDPNSGGFVKSVTEENGTVTVVYADPDDGDTTYTFTNTDTVTFDASEPVNGVVTVSATAKDTKYTFQSGNGITFNAPVDNGDGTFTISASVTEYSEGNGISIADGVISADIVQGANVEITTDATTGQMTISATDTDTTLDNYTTTGDTGIQVLTRKLAADGVSYEYMWETIDRSYEAQPAQPTQQ